MFLSACDEETDSQTLINTTFDECSRLRLLVTQCCLATRSSLLRLPDI